MTTKQYFEQIEKLDRKIDRKIYELDEYRQMAYGVSSVGYGERVQNSPKQDQMGEIVSKIIKLEEEIDEMTDNFVDLKRAILAQMERLNNKQYENILYQKYFKYKSIYEISKETHKDYRNLKRLHNRALKKFEEKLQDND